MSSSPPSLRGVVSFHQLPTGPAEAEVQILQDPQSTPFSLCAFQSWKQISLQLQQFSIRALLEPTTNSEIKKGIVEIENLPHIQYINGMWQ